MKTLRQQLDEAMWRGDQDRLWDLAPCICCCAEHTFDFCKARLWGGCYGQGTVEEDPNEWAAFYAKTRGMTRDDFFAKEPACSPTE